MSFLHDILSTRKQKSGEALDQFLNELKTLVKDCNFTQVSAEVYKSEMIRDAFIDGLLSNDIRQQLLESKTLDLQSPVNQARLLEVAQQIWNAYTQSLTTEISAVISINKPSPPDNAMGDVAAIAPKTKTSNQTCWFCGNCRHPRSICPARDATCHKCKKFGQFDLRRYVNQHVFLLLLQNMIAYNMIMTITVQLLHH